MKTKRITAGIISAMICLSMTTACGSSEQNNSDSSTGASQTSASSSEDQKSDTKQESLTEESNAEEIKEDNTSSGLHTLYIRDAGKNEKMTATFINTGSDETVDIEMTKSEEDGDHTTFTCDADPTLYNMVHLSYGEDIVSKDVAFNSYVAGWYLKDKKLLPYAEGMDLKYDPSFDTKTFKFDGHDKTVYIWTPDDYDKDSNDKYSTIYMFDGQTVLATGRDRGMDSDKDSWNVSESVEGMMSVTDNKAIVVCIATGDENREDELVPDLGELNNPSESIDPLISKKRGNAFADFVCDTIIPYVQENYNVYTDAQHTSLAGSSLGGLESFYAVLSHPESFGTAGVLSPSFWAYVDDTWADFLKDKVKMENAPFLYVYAGSYASDNGENAEDVYNMLLEMGYPKDRMVFNKYEPGEHTPTFWRNMYPEFLQAMFMQKTEALECGVPIQYKDRSSFDDIPRDVSIDPNDPKLKDKNNYIYYDNSETKWDKVYAYWWDAIPTNKISGGLYGAEWPGIELEKIEGTDIYRLIMPMGPTMIIFSSGITDEEVAKGTIAYQTEDMPYDDQKNAGQVYKIDMSQEPSKGRGVEKTKYKYPAGEWSDYNP